MFVITVAVLAIFNLFPGALWAEKKGELERQASVLAHSWLEEVRARPFASWQSNASPESLPAFSQGGVTFEPTLQALEVDDYSPARMLELQVTVSYRFRDTQHRVKHSLYVTKIKR